MGLDQYLTARIYLPKFARPAPPMPAPVNISTIPGITMTAQKIPVPVGEPVPNPRYQRVIEALGLDEQHYPENYGLYVEITAGYWRKANQIHAWFERTVADGELENCKHYDVSREQLQELRDTCQAVLDTAVWGTPIHHEPGPFSPEGWDEPVLLSLDTAVAADLLPTQSGFFYGDTDYDGWYAQDLQRTVEILDLVLTDPAFTEADFEYHGWW